MEVTIRIEEDAFAQMIKTAFEPFASSGIPMFVFNQQMIILIRMMQDYVFNSIPVSVVSVPITNGLPDEHSLIEQVAKYEATIPEHTYDVKEGIAIWMILPKNPARLVQVLRLYNPAPPEPESKIQVAGLIDPRGRPLTTTTSKDAQAL